MIIRDLIVKEHRVLTETQARAQLMEDPVFRDARQFGQLLVEYNLTKAQVQQLFKDVEQGATAAGNNRTGLGKAKDFTTKAIGSVQNMLASARKWVKERPTYQAVDAEYNKAMTALGKAGGDNGEANAITKAIYKYRDAAKKYPRATGLAKWAIITAAGLATGGLGGAGVSAGLAAIDSALKDKEIVDIVGDAAAAALVSGAVQGASNLGGQALDAYRGLPSDATVAANNAALGGFNDSGVPGGAASNINGLDMPPGAAAGDGTAMGDIEPNIVGPGVQGLSPEEISKLAAQAKAYGLDGDVTLDQLNKAIMQTAEPGTVPADYSQIGAGTGGSTYTVTADDFKGLGKIAQDHGLTAQQLWDANPQITDPDKIFIGQEINIPAATGEPVKNVWQGWEGPTKSTAPAVEPGPGDTVPTLTFSNPNGPQPIDTGSAGSTARYIPQKDGSWIDASTGKIADPAKLQASQAAVRNALGVKESVWSKVAESVKVKVLPNNQLIDSKFTVYAWALNESTNREMGRSLQITKLGVRTIFENIGRYRSVYLKEYIGAPTADYGHPTAAGAPASATAGQGKPQGWFGRGLDTIGRGVDAVGKWASNVGHNVITKVTADKLNNMWNRAGEPYDSDRLYQLLTTEWGVPKQVVDSVYQRMNLSAAPAATTTTVPTSAPTSAVPNFGRQITGYSNVNQPTAVSSASAAPAPAAPNPFGQMTKTLATYAPPTTTSTGGTLTPTSTGQVHRAKANNPNAAVANPTTAPTKKHTGGKVAGQYSQTPNAIRKREARAAKNAPGTNTTQWKGRKPAGKLGAYNAALDNLSAGREAERKNLANLPANALESLSWSSNFNPGMTLYRQMKQEDLYEVSLGDYTKKATISRAGAQIDKTFYPGKSGTDQTIAKRTKGLERARARSDRANDNKPSAPVDVGTLKNQMSDLQNKFQKLGGTSYQYADRMMPQDYEAEQLHKQIISLARKIQAAG